MSILTKKEKELKTQLQNLIEEFGYWSKEVYNFNNTLDYTIMSRINNNINSTNK